LVAHNPHYTARREEKGVGREGEEVKVEDVKPPPPFGTSETKETPGLLLLLHRGTALHGYTASTHPAPVAFIIATTGEPLHLSLSTTVMLDGHHFAVSVPGTSKGNP
jgi:hypothetical protein